MALLIAGNGAVFAEDQIPPRFVFPIYEDPIWIAASEAISAEGKVSPEVLRSSGLDHLERRRAWLKEQRARDAAEGHSSESSITADCDAILGGMTEFSGGWTVRSLAELMEEAATRTVITGVVTASAVGFHGGMPHTILAIRTDSPAADRVVYMLYPNGRLHYEGMTVCNQDPGYALPPSVGDAITFVATDEPFDSTRTLYVTNGSWIFYEHAGKVVASLALRSDPVLKAYRSLGALNQVLRGKAARPVD